MYIDKSIAGSDCADILKRYPSQRGKDGVYNIMDVSYKMKAVYCDMTTDNGGWTVMSLLCHSLINLFLSKKKINNDYKNIYFIFVHT